MNSEFAVKISNLEFKYEGAREPLLLLSGFTVKRGEKVFLQGDSGSGKSTLLSLITGILTATVGVVEVLGSNFSEATNARRDEIRGDQMGYIFQQFNLIPYLSTEQNISLPCRLHPRRSQNLNGASLRDEVRRLSVALSIENFLHRKVTELSVGQQQRVAAARALIGNPELVIADEPTSSLDHNQRGKFIELLMAECEKEKATLLFVSHDPTLAKFFDRSVSMDELNRQHKGVSE